MEDPSIYRILGPIYISSILPIEQEQDLFESHKITTIISITDSDIPTKYKSSPYKNIQIKLNDTPQDIIFPYIGEINYSIAETIYINPDMVKPKLSGNAVLIHCQSGISRSVTFVCAYLMNKFKLSLENALHAIRRNYPNRTFEPNEGFLEQLEIYNDTEYTTDLQLLKNNSPRWRGYRMKYLINQLYDEDNINKDSFSEVSKPEINDNLWFGFQCCKCRTLLANNLVYVPHLPPFDKDDKQLFFYKRGLGNQIAQNKCTHIFTEPLNWMKDKILENDDSLQGRLDCYKCNSKVGNYNWKGGRCSCGKWMIPSIYLYKSKVNQIDSNGKLILQNDPRAI